MFYVIMLDLQTTKLLIYLPPKLEMLVAVEVECFHTPISVSTNLQGFENHVHSFQRQV